MPEEQAPKPPVSPTVPEVSPSPKATPIDAAALVSDLAANMPEVTPGVGDTERAPTDAQGTEFREDYHAANGDGTPKTDKRGCFYPATSGRPKKAKFADPKRGKPAPSPAPKGSPAPTPTNAGGGERPPPTFASVDGVPAEVLGAETPGGASVDPDARFVLMADAYLRLGYAPIISILGIEAKPDADEHEALKQSLVPVLKLYAFEDLHPLIGFAAAVGGVALAKAEKPSVRQRFAAFMAKFRKPAPQAPK